MLMLRGQVDRVLVLFLAVFCCRIAAAPTPDLWDILFGPPTPTTWITTVIDHITYLMEVPLTDVEKTTTTRSKRATTTSDTGKAAVTLTTPITQSAIVQPTGAPGSLEAAPAAPAAPAAVPAAPAASSTAAVAEETNNPLFVPGSSSPPVATQDAAAQDTGLPASKITLIACMGLVGMVVVVGTAYGYKKYYGNVFNRNSWSSSSSLPDFRSSSGGSADQRDSLFSLLEIPGLAKLQRKPTVLDDISPPLDNFENEAGPLTPNWHVETDLPALSPLSPTYQQADKEVVKSSSMFSLTGKSGPQFRISKLLLPLRKMASHSSSLATVIDGQNRGSTVSIPETVLSRASCSVAAKERESVVSVGSVVSVVSVSSAGSLASDVSLSSEEIEQGLTEKP
ncbi:hypothetical protein HDU91_007212 [Kappamyces sp. JEL0680]|nr:hypothetical protein HDU91_007212 [Kappamyces sp. JEL0680]